jgi:hypothetical protein
MRQSLSSKEKKEWLNLYSNSPSFFYFKENLQTIFNTNIRLCLIFIALREAVKGWAVAARQLKESNPVTAVSAEQGIVLAEILIYEDFMRVEPVKGTQTENHSYNASYSESQIKPVGSEIVVSSPHGIEKNLLPDYLKICKFDYNHLLKSERFLVARVDIERMLLTYLSLFPHLIFSPINVVLKLTSQYENFPELLYLLSEHFPTFTVQRLMFSGYMLK